MVKELAIQDENIKHLAEEVLAIIANAHRETTISMIAAKHMVGEAIFESPLYEKYSKSQGALYEEIARESGVKSGTLTDCVKLYEAYPRRKSLALAKKLYLDHGAWRNVRLALYGGDLNATRKVEEELSCNHKCPRHCKKNL